MLVIRAVGAITGGLDEAIDLGRLAKNAALSPFHFHRIFRGMVGETPLELHRRLRLERAAYQLADGDRSVLRIALEAGYESHEAFTRAFRRRYADSPSAFRTRFQRPGCGIDSPYQLPARSPIHYRAGDDHPSFFRKESPMDVTLETLKTLRLGALRHLGPYNQIGAAFEKLGAIAGGSGLFGPEAAMLAIYHDDPDSVEPAKLRSDACIVVSQDKALPDSLTEAHLPAGTYAKTVHVGAYEGLTAAWGELMGQWLPASEHRLGTGPSFEIYRNAPGQVPDSELITELYIPIGA